MIHHLLLFSLVRLSSYNNWTIENFGWELIEKNIFFNLEIYCIIKMKILINY